MIIGINCGHSVNGQAGSGAVGFLNESNETRAIGRTLIKRLKELGHTVIDCTNDKAESVNDNLKKIVALANAQRLDLFVSIHLNAGKGQGCECYTYAGEKHIEAVNICEKVSSLGFKNRGVKDGSALYVLRKTNAKAVLVEVCFVDNRDDASLYKKLGADKIASAIGEAIGGKAQPWYAEAQKWAVDNGISDGTRPHDTTTRAEVWAMLQRLQRGDKYESSKS